MENLVTCTQLVLTLSEDQSIGRLYFSPQTSVHVGSFIFSQRLVLFFSIAQHLYKGMKTFTQARSTISFL